MASGPSPRPPCVVSLANLAPRLNGARLKADAALRAGVHGVPAADDLRDSIIHRARELGVLGWARATDADMVQVHAEGDAAVLDELVTFLRDAAAPSTGIVEVERVGAEGHEQFAARGVSAGAFVVQEHQASTHHFDLRLEVDGVMRSWAVPKGPSLDPAAKRLAVQVEDHDKSHNTFEGGYERGGTIVWDHGPYEQGGRVAWPEALVRGHAVFVLHGQKLRGGFALQRTRPVSPPQWLLIKRRDDEARPGGNVVADHPGSVLSGQTLEELLAAAGRGPGAPDR
jgi:DNA ligase D-like protein (predicted 3'-phosphoesterase)